MGRYISRRPGDEMDSKDDIWEIRACHWTNHQLWVKPVRNSQGLHGSYFILQSDINKKNFV